MCHGVENAKRWTPGTKLKNVWKNECKLSDSILSFWSNPSSPTSKPPAAWFEIRESTYPHLAFQIMALCLQMKLVLQYLLCRPASTGRSSPHADAQTALKSLVPPVLFTSMVSMITWCGTKIVASSHSTDEMALIGRQWAGWCRGRRHPPWMCSGGCCAINWHASCVRAGVVLGLADCGCHFDWYIQSSGQFAHEGDEQGYQLWHCEGCKLRSVHGDEQKLQRVVDKPAHPPLARQRCKRIIKCANVKNQMDSVRKKEMCSKLVSQTGCKKQR